MICLHKGDLISEDILTLVQWPTKGAKSYPRAELNFPALTINNLFKVFAHGSNLAPFVGNGTEVKILSEIDPTLVDSRHITERFPTLLGKKHKTVFSFLFSASLANLLENHTEIPYADIPHFPVSFTFIIRFFEANAYYQHCYQF